LAQSQQSLEPPPRPWWALGVDEAQEVLAAMEEDTSSPGWPARAACRWVLYSALWCVLVAAGLASSLHTVLAVATVLLGCLLSVALPLAFCTLFEESYSRRARRDLPLLCVPLLGAVVVVLGAVALLESSAFVVAFASTASVSSASELSERFARLPRSELPRTVCVRHAFVRTDWEAGKLHCERVDGHMDCAPAFVAAPIFDDKERADNGKDEEIHAWAVTHGRHCDVNYRPDGTLCGFLSGLFELDFDLSDYRLAVRRTIQKNHLSLATSVEGSEEVASPSVVPLEDRPLLFTADPAEATHIEQAWLVAAAILLCFCPCAGPVPLGATFVYFCWARRAQHAGRQVVAPDDFEDYDDDDYNFRGPFRP